MEYRIPILRTKIKKKHMTSMHLIAGFMAILLGALILAVPPIMQLNFTVIRIPLGILSIITGVIFIIVTIIANKKLANKKNNSILRVTELALFIVLISYTLLNTWWMHLAYATIGLLAISVTYFLELTAHKPEYITINETGVHMKKWKTKTIDWAEIKNFLIRHGNVTINLNNNTLYQFTAYDIKNINDKDEAEKFAKEKIEANKHRYQADW